MPSPVVAAFQQAIRAKRASRPDPDLALVAHCVAQALALTPAELTRVTAGVRAAIAAGDARVTVLADSSGRIDETKLPPLPRLPPAGFHPLRVGPACDRLVTRLVATARALTAKELTLVTQGVRAGVAARGEVITRGP